MRTLFTLAALLPLWLAAAGSAEAQDVFVLSSPAITNGGPLPADLKCERDGGDGVSPPLTWDAVPDGTKSLALIMYHYPRGTVEGLTAPSQYWLLWNIPADTLALPRGNPESIGDEGSDKDGRRTGYTPPCSPRPWFSFFSGPQHEYFIELIALRDPLTSLPTDDDVKVDWTAMTKSMEGKVIASTRISFWN